MKQDWGHREGYITIDELRESWNEGNESILSFAGGAVIAILTDGMDKLAQSRWGKWFGLGFLAVFAAACVPSPVNSFVTPEITPAAPPTPTLVAPGENINFHAEVDINSTEFSLVSRALGSSMLDTVYPGAMERLRALNYDPSKMSFVQFTIADDQGGDEEYLIAMDPVSNKILIPWEIDKNGWGTPDQLEPPEGNRYEWSEADVKLAEDGGFEIAALSGRYFVVGRTGGENGKWSVGLPLRDVNTGKNVVIDQVRGGGGMLFAPAEFLRGGSGIDESEEWAGAEFTPGAGGGENNSNLPGTNMESLPADVAEILKGYPGYTIVDDDNNGTGDRIVIANGDNLFKFVPPGDRYDPNVEWQRMHTFILTSGEKLEMPRFETFDEAMMYIAKHAFWRTGDRMRQLDFWTSFDNPKGGEFFSKIKKIPGWSPYTGFTSPSNSDKFVLLGLDKIGNRAFLEFEPEENLFELIYVNESVESYNSLEGTHSVPTPQP